MWDIGWWGRLHSRNRDTTTQSKPCKQADAPYQSVLGWAVPGVTVSNNLKAEADRTDALFRPLVGCRLCFSSGLIPSPPALPLVARPTGFEPQNPPAQLEISDLLVPATTAHAPAVAADLLKHFAPHCPEPIVRATQAASAPRGTDEARKHGVEAHAGDEPHRQPAPPDTSENHISLIQSTGERTATRYTGLEQCMFKDRTGNG